MNRHETPTDLLDILDIDIFRYYNLDDQGLRGLRPLDPSARRAQITLEASGLMYRGLEAPCRNSCQSQNQGFERPFRCSDSVEYSSGWLIKVGIDHLFEFCIIGNVKRFVIQFCIALKLQIKVDFAFMEQ